LSGYYKHNPPTSPTTTTPSRIYLLEENYTLNSLIYTADTY
jgi:hypothetical protein